MTITHLDPSELPALGEFFRQVGASVPEPNLQQFSMPRPAGPGPGVGTLVLKEGGRILGSIGYLEIPLRLAGESTDTTTSMRDEIARWPINHFLLPECRGRGFGRSLMEAAWEGTSCLLAIGGTESSIPARDKSWRPVGQLTCWRFRAPAHRLIGPGKLGDRLGGTSRRVPPEQVSTRAGRRLVVARRRREMAGWLPWVDPDPRPDHAEIGTTRDADYLRFAFFGTLSRYHVIYTVSVDGALAGFFVLAARADRPPLLSIEIIDLDAAPGHETEVIEAARATAFTRGDVVRFRTGCARFMTALGVLRGYVRQSPDHAFRVSTRGGSLVDRFSGDLAAWRLTYGDHDQYRVRTASQVWSEA